MAIFTPKLLLVSIAPGVSNQQKDGHYHWYYKRLSQEFDSQGYRSVIGKKLVELQGETWWEPILESRNGGHGFGPSKFREIVRNGALISQHLHKAPSRSAAVCQFYDGSLHDMSLLVYLAPLHPNIAFIFNFRPGKKWLDVLQRDRVSGRFLANRINNAPQNVFFYAETSRLRDKISRLTGAVVRDYHVYSSQEFKAAKPRRDRRIDVVFAPKTEEELSWCESLLSLLGAEGAVTSEVLIPSKLLTTLKKQEGRGGFSSIQVAPLSASSYKELLEDAKVLVLPYLKEYFALGSSGKINDAILSGAMPFLPEDSAPALQIRSAILRSQVTFPPSRLSETAEKLRRLISLDHPLNLEGEGVSFEDFSDDMRERSREVRESPLTRGGGWDSHSWIWVFMLSPLLRERETPARITKRIANWIYTQSGLIRRFGQFSSRLSAGFRVAPRGERLLDND